MRVALNLGTQHFSHHHPKVRDTHLRNVTHKLYCQENWATVKSRNARKFSRWHRKPLNTWKPLSISKLDRTASFWGVSGFSKKVWNDAIQNPDFFNDLGDSGSLFHNSTRKNSVIESFLFIGLLYCVTLLMDFILCLFSLLNSPNVRLYNHRFLSNKYIHLSFHMFKKKTLLEGHC